LPLEHSIIPTIISQIFAGNEKIAVGNVTPTRDLTFVKDTCRGFLEIFRSPKLYGEITNIGMGQEISVRDLINKICSLTQANISIHTDELRIRPENSEVERLFCDNRKLIANSKWKPYYDLDMGLKETIDWVKSNLDKYKSEIYNV